MLDYSAWKYWQIFLDCQDQWRILPNGGLGSLDATSVKSVIDLHQLKKPLKAYRAVMLIQRGAKACLKNQELVDLIHG